MFSWEVSEFFRSNHQRDFAIFTVKLQVCNLVKNRLQQLFSSEYGENFNFKSTYFEEVY